MNYVSLSLRSVAVLLVLSAFSLGLTSVDARPARQRDKGSSSNGILGHTNAGRKTTAVYAMGIEGMMCESSCAAKVRDSLSSIEGVSTVDLDFAAKTARVHMRSRHVLTSASCDASFDNQGYFVTDFRRLN